MQSKSKYSGIGIVLGAALGAVLGVIAGHVGAWLAIGLVIGMVLGASIRWKQPRCPQCAALHHSHAALPQGGPRAD
jgi:predicted lysophospholipase L1 biosynthesis ABC-type transport system permease subunit